MPFGKVWTLHKNAFFHFRSLILSRSTCVKHLPTIWLIPALFKAFTLDPQVPTQLLPPVEKPWWSSLYGKAQLSKKGNTAIICHDSAKIHPHLYLEWLAWPRGQIMQKKVSCCLSTEFHTFQGNFLPHKCSSIRKLGYSQDMKYPHTMQQSFCCGQAKPFLIFIPL